MEIDIQKGLCKIKVEKKKRTTLLKSLEKFTDSFWISLNSNEKIEVEVKPRGEEDLNNFEEKFTKEMRKNG